MPRKIRELKQDLRKAGFIQRPSKRGHTVWKHTLLPYAVTLSGNDGDDAQSYQERDLRRALAELEADA